MIEFFLASSNAHKASEFALLCDSKLMKISSAPKAIDVLEDGESFQENAFKKAKAYFDAYQLPIIADDSGLCVQALPDELGLYSARFGGAGLTDRQRAELLLERLSDISGDERRAYFVCHLCFYLGPDEIYFFEGRLAGTIAEVYLGEYGFGYDPVFIPKLPTIQEESGKTLAQIPEWKQANSHRAVALQLATIFFKERHGQKS